MRLFWLLFFLSVTQCLVAQVKEVRVMNGSAFSDTTYQNARFIYTINFKSRQVKSVSTMKTELFRDMSR
jgi:hypothetical protein